MASYARPDYLDGYEIRYNSNTDLFECCKDGSVLSKKDGKPAAYKSTALAIKFMASVGAQVAPEKPKKPAWTRPERVELPSIEEQLAKLSEDAPRFVVIEAGYGSYHEQGYVVYDRESEETVFPHTYNGWNYVTQSKEEAEKEVVYRMENPPAPKIDVMAIVDSLFRPGTVIDWESGEVVSSDSRPAKPEPAPKEEVEFVSSSPDKAGDEIKDKDGHTYIAIEDSYYISPREAADIEDMNDVIVESGWHTKARLKHV